MLMDQAPQLQDLFGLRRIVPRVERAADHEKTHVAAEVGMTREEPAESAEQDVDPLDLLDATHEEDDALALIAAKELARVGLPHRSEERRVDTARNDVDLRGVPGVEIAELFHLDLARGDDGRGFVDGLALDRHAHVALAGDVLVHQLTLS